MQHPEKWIGNNPLYRVWQQMRWRCSRPNNKGFRFYGARGIQVCKEWQESFTAFQSWALSNGYQRGLTIERRDNNGNYCPENCAFITRAEQSRNTRSNFLLTAFGETKTLSAWAEDPRCLIKRATLRERIVNQRMSPATAMTLPLLKSPRDTVTAFGQTKTAREWSRDARCKVTRETLVGRLNRHTLSTEEAIVTPPRPWARYRIKISESQFSTPAAVT
jgi:hypothetical protein